ncbi:MAG: VanZ family protein [Desulfobacula sp.]|jgi:VanZ family protein|nr:VanZ family protein [Desulfobacula sp.]
MHRSSGVAGNNETDFPELFQPADAPLVSYNVIIISLLTFIILTIIGTFSCLHYKNVNAIYDFLGTSVGIQPTWITAHYIEISNVGHIAAYCLLVITLAGWQQMQYLKISIIVLIIAGGFEIIQLWIPTRQGDMKDIGYNILGILCGYILLVSYIKIDVHFTWPVKR